jgi:hypothetical protein
MDASYHSYATRGVSQMHMHSRTTHSECYGGFNVHACTHIFDVCGIICYLIFGLICAYVSSFPAWTDFWVAVPLALIITVVRLFICDPLATRLCVARLGLAKDSLRQRNAKEEPGKRIPKWVLNEIDGFALDMLIVRTHPLTHQHQLRQMVFNCKHAHSFCHCANCSS